MALLSVPELLSLLYSHNKEIGNIRLILQMRRLRLSEVI